MAQTGLSPAAAAPAAKQTACASAMPTSKYRSGCFLANFENFVPSGIAAVTPMIRLSRSAKVDSASPNASENVGRPLDLNSIFPFSTSKGPTPCQVRLSCSAGSKPLPLIVLTWSKTGPFSLRTFEMMSHRPS